MEHSLPYHSAGSQRAREISEDIPTTTQQEEISASDSTIKIEASSSKVQTKRKRKKKRKSSETRERKQSVQRDSLQRNIHPNSDVCVNYHIRNRTGSFTSEEVNANDTPVVMNSTATAMSTGTQCSLYADPFSVSGHRNNGYVQQELPLDAMLTPVDTDLPASDSTIAENTHSNRKQKEGTITVIKQKSEELVLKPKTLNNMDTDKESKFLTPKQIKQNGTNRVAPRRTASFPTRQASRGRTDSTSSKWTAVKHAVKITHTMAKHQKSKQDSFMEKFNTNRRVTESLLHPMEMVDEHQTEINDGIRKGSTDCSKQLRAKCLLTVFHPDGNFLFFWLMVLSVTVEYNLWTLILRQAFPPVQKDFGTMWFVFDALADLIYILDILVQFRTGFLEDGLLVSKQKRLAYHYARSRSFVMDLLSILPLDLFQFTTGMQPLVRFPRFIKIYRLVQFFYVFENQATYPNVLRVSNLTHILLLLCHWFAAFYYMISKSDNLLGTESINGSTTRLYLKSLYWSTLTLTTIGDLPTPESNWGYLFQILSYLIGVFVFATIVGQVGNSINNYNATRQEYEQLLDGAKLYMRKHEVPKVMQVRVQRWCDYAWSRGRMQGALDINSLKMLPDRLKTELALHVHLDILKQVSIFDDCEPEFLHDLVLKMKTYIFTPGDMVVRKGEIAREMFIIADGHLEVIGEKSQIIAKLSTGNFFGEIGILNLDGGINRRTADVTSVGYSELFVLKREDIVRAIKYYPSAKASLMKHAKKRLAEMREQNTAISESVLQDSPPEIHTIYVSEDENSASSHRLTVPRPQESPSYESPYKRRSSAYSIRSTELDNDTMGECDSEMEQVRENELIAKLTDELEKKNREIDRLTNELNKVCNRRIDDRSSADESDKSGKVHN